MPVVQVPENVLTQSEMEEIKGYLSKPLELPPEFKTWLNDYVAVNLPPIPVSQLMGYRSTLANYDVVVTRDNETSPESAWTEITTPGPEVAGLSNGTYWAAWGYHCPGEHAGQATTRMGLSINGADPATYCQALTLDTGKAVWRAAPLTLSSKDNNTITAKYWFSLGGGAEGQFQRRWMIVLRIT